MTFDQIKEAIFHGEKLFNLPLKVTFYSRVSTDSEIQLNSLENQTQYYTHFIQSIKNWTLIDGYVEEGVSGVRVDKRDSFKKMIRDARMGKFNLIITKEVSRFARDLEDSIHYIRELKSYGVGILFENQNINTFDDNSELILNIMFNLAQDESKKLSKRIKFGHREAIKNGHVLGSSNITGYTKENCRLVINNQEAKFVKKLFELYATGEFGLYRLSKKLGELGFYNKNNRLYDKDTLKRILSNPKYKGFYRGHTYEILDYRTKKRKRIPLEEQFIYKTNNTIIPPIVSEELWNQANDILNARTYRYQKEKSYSGSLKYPFSSKIYCEEHRTSFVRSHGNKSKRRPTWSCSLYVQHGLASCSSPIIAEIDLYNIFNHIMKSIITNKDKIIKDMIELYTHIRKNNQYNMELNIIADHIEKIENKKSLALDLVAQGELKLHELKIQFERFENTISLLNNKREEILQQIQLLRQSDNISIISNSIKEELDGNMIEEFIRNFVNEIIVSKINNDKYSLKLDIFLNIFADEKANIKNTKYIHDMNDSLLYLKNQSCQSIENLRVDHKKNQFTYNVYIEEF